MFIDLTMPIAAGMPFNPVISLLCFHTFLEYGEVIREK